MVFEFSPGICLGVSRSPMCFKYCLFSVNPTSQNLKGISSCAKLCQKTWWCGLKADNYQQQIIQLDVSIDVNRQLSIVKDAVI